MWTNVFLGNTIWLTWKIRFLELYMGIKQVKHFLPKDSLKTLYLALIQPYISYGILIWGNANSSILKKNVSLQKRAIRIINNAGYNYHTDPLFKKCEIFKLSDSWTTLVERSFLILSMACSVLILIYRMIAWQGNLVIWMYLDVTLHYLVNCLYSIFLVYGITGIVPLLLVNQDHKLRKLWKITS